MLRNYYNMITKIWNAFANIAKNNDDILAFFVNTSSQNITKTDAYREKPYYYNKRWEDAGKPANNYSFSHPFLVATFLKATLENRTLMVNFRLELATGLKGNDTTDEELMQLALTLMAEVLISFENLKYVNATGVIASIGDIPIRSFIVNAAKQIELESAAKESGFVATTEITLKLPIC